MIDLREALAEISSIRGHLARGIEFRGYGPTTLATTGLLAFVSACIQGYWIPDPMHSVSGYLVLWTTTAAVSLILIGIETAARARRVHSGLVAEMLRSAIEPFLPALVAGVLLTVVLVRCAPRELWMLPSLWQILFSLAVFSSCRFLPKQTFGVGVWYLATGITCLVFGQGEGALAPWEMGVPFGVGHLLVAGVLQLGYLQDDEQV